MEINSPLDGISAWRSANTIECSPGNGFHLVLAQCLCCCDPAVAGRVIWHRSAVCRVMQNCWRLRGLSDFFQTLGCNVRWWNRWASTTSPEVSATLCFFHLASAFRRDLIANSFVVQNRDSVYCSPLPSLLHNFIIVIYQTDLLLSVANCDIFPELREIAKDGRRKVSNLAVIRFLLAH